MTLPRHDDQYVSVEGKTIRYWAEGQGPAVVLVHGLAASVEYWQYNLAPLAKEHRVYAVDLLGFGRSEKEIGDFSLSYSASFLASFLDAVGEERAALAGNSLGGLVCAQAAVEFPERVERLVLVDSAGFGRELNPFLRLWSLPVAGGAVFRVYQRVFPFLKRWAFHESDSIDQEWLAAATDVLRTAGVRENSLRVARAGVDLRGQRVDVIQDLLGQLASLRVPTLIIWGSRDVVVPSAHAYTAQELIPKSEARIMEGCGHTPQVERPEEFNQLVLDFLSADTSS